MRKYALPIAVILLIAAIAIYFLLLPALLRARESARRTNCVCNLKQLGTGIEIYTDETYYGGMPVDKDGFHPEWMYDNGNGVVPDLAVFRCPSRPDSDHTGFQCDYIFNPNVSVEDSPTTIIARCKIHKGMMLFKDAHVKYYEKPDDADLNFDVPIPKGN